MIMGMEAYQRRWSVILGFTVALLVFHPHLTVRPYPMPSCEFTSVHASQAALIAICAMLGYRLLRVFLYWRSTKQHRDASSR
jgi:hypothetical protein